MIDFTVENHGSVFLLRAVSEAGRDWAKQHLPEDAPRFGLAYAIEHHYIGDIVQGIAADGLEVR